MSLGSPSPAPLNVLVVAPGCHERQWLHYALDTVPGVVVIGGAFSIDSTLQSLARQEPDVVVSYGDAALPVGLLSAETERPIPIVIIPSVLDPQSPWRAPQVVVVQVPDPTMSEGGLGLLLARVLSTIRDRRPPPPMHGSK